MKLIDKDAVLAEIDKRIKTCLNQREEMIIADCETLAGDATARAGELQCLRDSIESFEVTEVDLEKPFEGVKVQTSMESGSLDEVIVTTKYKAQK